MNNITLEMVDDVINRTGASYKEAKEALEFCEGNVLDAIVYIETVNSDSSKKNEFYDAGNEMLEKLKEFVKKGNVSRIVFEKNNKTMLDIPVIAGAVGALIFAGPTLIAIVAAIAIGAEIKVITDDGEVINLNKKTEETVKNMKEKMNEFTNSFKKEDSEDVTDEEKNEESNEETPNEENTSEEEKIVVDFKKDEE
ncbi:DUF4342 domain-containing protein [Helicovermis profundi]|uniref:DUF4342 domain-containing protein n=1 Tax=Helicovermis profundi TaxID=3065157 RepID=A0AAU9ENG4_9FIRM|nr:DUF4342 domain-containing protein [Clostridia bacterium S502]